MMTCVEYQNTETSLRSRHLRRGYPLGSYMCFALFPVHSFNDFNSHSTKIKFLLPLYILSIRMFLFIATSDQTGSRLSTGSMSQ